MANTVKMKRSAVPGKIPATTDLDLGEIAINTYDGKAYIKKNVSGIESIVPLGGAGSGDVTGPNSSTDKAIARFDGASGKIIQNSTGTIDDLGNASLASLTLTTALALTDGGTGASDAAGARSNLGLGALATLSSVGTSQITNDAVTFEKLASADWARSLSSAGYTEIAGGMFIQWGRVSSIAGNGTANITFSVTFPNACTGVQTCVNTSGDINEIVQAYSVTQSGATLRNSNPGTLAVYWLAYGY